MVLDKGIWDPKPRVSNSKGTNLKSFSKKIIALSNPTGDRRRPAMRRLQPEFLHPGLRKSVARCRIQGAAWLRVWSVGFVLILQGLHGADR